MKLRIYSTLRWGEVAEKNIMCLPTMSNGPSLRSDAILDVDKTCLHFTIEREARQEATCTNHAIHSS